MRHISYLRSLMSATRYISVILPLKLEWEPCYSIDRDVCIGDRVKVVFAGREYSGVVSGKDIRPDIDRKKIKPVITVEDDMGRILPMEMELWRKVAEYYLCTVGEVFKAAYPYGKINLEEARAAAKQKVRQKRERIIESIRQKVSRLQERLVNKKAQFEKTREGTKLKARLEDEITKTEDELARFIAALETEAGRAADHEDRTVPFERSCSISLSAPQEKAYNEILSGFRSGKPVLLNGVTGSGKTEIYIRLAHDAISKGRNVLYLVPEIALSRQLEERLEEHFGERLLCYHSGETAAAKRNVAETIREGYGKKESYIVLGTRSSLFLPHHNLGLIIVDEEHDSSYKQDSPAPRYNGRDTALILSRLSDGKDSRCRIILGSATPSLEEHYNCSTGRHICVRLTEKFHGSDESEIEIIDTKAERRKRGMHGSFSRKLIDHIRNTLNEGGQALILRSRRAWSPVMQCEGCGELVKCPRCNVTLSYHKTSGHMTCHYCGYKTSYTGKCGKCGGNLASLGAGTQKIEEEISALFPDARVARLDSDTNQNKTFEKKTIKGFSRGEIDILVGTQIITKGFDFGNLRLVAVIAADSLLGIQDFRADEKAFQILEQFRGRCGRRGKKGLLVIQTSQPEHPIYQKLAANDTASLSTQLLQERSDFSFPPYSRIIEITFKDLYEDRAERMSARLAGIIRNRINVEIAGPYAPVVDKIADLHIRKIRISMKKDRNLSDSKKTLAEAIGRFESENRYDGHIIIDVDPS